MKSINLKGNLISLEKPIIMGILNITEDSFFDGGQYVSETAVLNQCEKMLYEGATIIDLGAVSTRPNAKIIDTQQEFSAVQKNLKSIISHFPNALISIDTFRANVAEMAINEGAAMINDVSGGNSDMFNVVGKYKVPYCLTHNNRGKVITTEKLISEMLSFFGNQIEQLKIKGINDIIIDVGFGFGKTTEQNYFLLKNLAAFKMLDFPILVGISRKSMICSVLEKKPQEVLGGTLALNMLALQNGGGILRVHEVGESAEVIKLYGYCT